MMTALQTADVPYLTDLIESAGGPLYFTAAFNAVVIVPLHDLLVSWHARPEYKARASALLALAAALMVTWVSGVDVTLPLVIGEVVAALGGKELGYRIQSEVVKSSGRPTLLALPVEGGLGFSPEAYGLTPDPTQTLTRDGVLFTGQAPAATGTMDPVAQGD